MARKPFTLRLAVITTAAVTAGSATGTLVDTITTQHQYSQLGAGQLAAAIVTLWMLDKLNSLIDDPQYTPPPTADGPPSRAVASVDWSFRPGTPATRRGPRRPVSPSTVPHRDRDRPHRLSPRGSTAHGH